YTPKLLAAAFMSSFEKNPADRFPALLAGKDSGLMAERVAYNTVQTGRTVVDLLYRADRDPCGCRYTGKRIHY
ncbi:hypothetical protein H6B10_17510, partial [Gemmiger formicilis]|uniref:hypothetical protein n=1 Tax=Gemmiger formicilis TaxID=745368 RepID=UPI00195EB2F7